MAKSSKKGKKKSKKEYKKKTTSEFCKLLDRLHHHKDSKAVVPLILNENYCMGGFFTRTRKVLFVVPNKNSDIGGVDDLKSYVMRKPITQEEEVISTYSGEYPNWLQRMVVVKSDKVIEVDGVKCNKLFEHYGSHVYKATKKLPAAEIKTVVAELEGGGISLLTNLKGDALRRKIIEDYKNAFPSGLYDCGTIDHWPNWLYPSVVLHMRDTMPNFGDTILPWLGTDPVSSVELIFQYRLDEHLNAQRGGSAHPYIFDDDFFRSFRESQYYLNGDYNIMKNARDLILSLQTSVNNDITNKYESPTDMEEIISYNKKMLLEHLKTGKEPKFGDKLVAVYKKVYGDLDHANPEQHKLYKKVYDDTAMVKLSLDLIRFNVNMLKDSPNFDNILDFLHSGDLIHTLGNYIDLKDVIKPSSWFSFFGGSTDAKLHTVFGSRAYWEKFLNHVAFMYTMGRDFPGANPYDKSPLFFDYIPVKNEARSIEFGAFGHVPYHDHHGHPAVGTVGVRGSIEIEKPDRKMLPAEMRFGIF